MLPWSCQPGAMMSWENGGSPTVRWWGVHTLSYAFEREINTKLDAAMLAGERKERREMMVFSSKRKHGHKMWCSWTRGRRR